MPSVEQRQGSGAAQSAAPADGRPAMDPAAAAALRQQWLAQQAAREQLLAQQQQEQALFQQQIAMQQQALGQSEDGDEEDEGEEEEEEEEAEDAGLDPDDSEYTVGQEEEEEEEEESGSGQARRRQRDDSESQSDPDYEDARSARKRRRERTPPGARRSSRIKDRVIDVAGELEVEEEPEPAPRRGLRSLGPVQILEGSAPASTAPSGVASRAGSEAPAPKPVKASAASTLPNPKDIRREHSEEEMAEELGEVKSMWEMAAILDYLTLFKRQLNLSRTFAAAELEHVLAYSDGRDGLLADLHIDIMLGISPKQQVPRDQWQIHLANKIKYHWRPLLNGLHCPFKPDKYFEAYQYARLAAADRVRALHFLCTIRCDREDIQLRVSESYMREWTPPQLQLMMVAQQDAIRRGRPDEAPIVDLGTDSFRRQTNGRDASGARYYVLDFLRASDFRMYRNTPPAPAAGAEGGTAESAPAAEPEAAADNGRKAADQAPPSFHKEEPCSGASPEEDEQHKEPIGAGAAAVGAKGGAEGSPAPQEADARAAALHPAAGGTLRDEPGSKRAGEPAAQELADTTAAAAADERQEADGTASVVVKQEAAAAALKQDGAALGGKPAPAAASAALPFPAAPGIRPGTSLPFAMPPAMAQMAQAQMAQMAQAAAMGQPAAAAAVRAMAAQAAAMAGASGPAQAQWALQWQVMQAHLQAQMQAAAAAQAAATAQAAPLPQSDSEDDAWAERQARLERLQDYRVPPDPEPGPVKWELVASSLEEFEDHANRFAASGHPDEAALATTLRQFVIPPLKALKEEEERRIRAAERVQKKLGGATAPAAVAAGAAGLASGLAAPAAVASGSGGSGAVAAGRGATAAAVAMPVDGGREPGGRSRRARNRVNYAFADYDESLRSALRQRSEDDSDDEGGRRRRRRAPSPSGDPVEATRGGLRRGRSAAGTKGDLGDASQFVDERQLRAAVAYDRVACGRAAGSQAGSRVASGADLLAMEGSEAAAGEEQVAADGASLQPHGDGASQDAAAAELPPLPVPLPQPHAEPNGSGLPAASVDAAAAFAAAMAPAGGRGRGRGRGRGGGGGRGRGRKSGGKIEYISDESDESEADAGAADSSEDEEYVPSRNRRR